MPPPLTLNLSKGPGARYWHEYRTPAKAHRLFENEPEAKERYQIVRLSDEIYDVPALPERTQIFIGYSKNKGPHVDIGNVHELWLENWKQVYHLQALKSLALEKTACHMDLCSQYLDTLTSLCLGKMASPGAAQPVLETLDAQAKTDAVWTEDDWAELFDWALKNRARALQAARDNSKHGRLRWAVLEALATTPSDALRETLCQLVMDPDLDQWLLNGVPVVMRMTPMGKYRARAIKALRKQLTHVRDNQNNYREHVRECGVGELVMTFGSFAEAADFELVGGFALSDWKLKVRVCAFDSLRRMSQRFAEAKETTEFYDTHAAELELIGKAWAANFRTSADDGALFFAWLTTLLSRLGPEADMVEPILQAYPRHAARVRYELKQSLDASSAWSVESQARHKHLQRLTQVERQR